jgi:Ca-activated chloride channel family protein
MRELFDRHAERLTPAERRAIWDTVSGANAGRAPSRRRWVLSTAAMTAVAVLAFVVMNREPAAPRFAGTPAPIESEISVPATPRAEQHDGSSGVAELRAPRAEAQGLALRRLTADALNESKSSAPGVVPEGNAGHEIVADDLVVTAERRIDVKTSTSTQNLPDQLRKAASANGSPSLHVRGGRSSEVRVQRQGIEVTGPLGRDESTAHLAFPGTEVINVTPAAPQSPPVIPTTGGNRLPNDEAFDSMFFKSHGVNPFIATDEDALSTFAVDVDAASYTVTRRYLELGHLPPAEAVRVEEFVNFFPQGYPRFADDDFRILIDGAPSPFGPGYHLVRVGIKGREIEARDRKPAQLTFVIDVSGSMEREDRLGLVKRSLSLLVDQLSEDDRIGIVVYGSQGRVLLEPIALGDPVEGLASLRPHAGGESEREAKTGRDRILQAIDLLTPDGSTNAEEGLLLGYDMARRGFRPGAINRIVLCSDGVANVGRTGPESILQRVRTEADRGVHLSAIGFGMGNYNDVLMEQLANKGDGNYYYVDDFDEARRVFVENLTGTLQTIAKDAKIQVEFDSTRVLRYRLLGFENRDVADRDFRNDRVDAGEIGAGHEVTALYEVKLAPGVRGGTIATARLRYARPEPGAGGTPEVREIEKRFGVADLSRKFEDASPRFRLDAAVAEFAELLRGSYWARDGRYADVLSVARSAARGLSEGPAGEFITLVEKAAELSRKKREAGDE